jgi:hypothetical protein
MGRLVEAHLRAVGKGEGRHATPRLLGDRLGQPDALRLQRRDRGVEVVAEQVDLVPWRLGGVDGELADGRAKMSQPSPASTNEKPSVSRKKARTASAAGLKTMA